MYFVSFIHNKPQNNPYKLCKTVSVETPFIQQLLKREFDSLTCPNKLHSIIGNLFPLRSNFCGLCGIATNQKKKKETRKNSTAAT